MPNIFEVSLPASVEALVSKLATDPEVQSYAAPSSIPTTRGEYGRWMALLPQLAESAPLVDGVSGKAGVRLWAVVLDRAGADRRGLLDALRIIEGSG